MRKYVAKLLATCFVTSVILTGCSSSFKQENDKDNLLKDVSVNISNSIKSVNIVNTMKKNSIFINNKEDFQVFINAFTKGRLIINKANGLKLPIYIVSIYYGGTKIEEYFLYMGKDRAEMIGNGNDKTYDLTQESTLELNKLIEKYNKE